MTIRNEAKIERRIQDKTDEMIERLDLGWLDVTNRFLTHRDGQEGVLCEAKTNWEYRRVSFHWNTSSAATALDDEIENAVIHELVHALNASLYDELSPKMQARLAKNNELATENVARAILAALSK